MTLDEQLKRAFDTLSDRLRDEMSRQVQAMAEDLAESARESERAADEARARAIEDARQRALDEARARALEDSQRAVAETRQRALEEGREQARQETEAALAQARERALQESQRALDEARQRALEEGRLSALEEFREREEQDARERAHEAAAGARALERLADGIRAIDSGRTLGEVLNALVSGAARDAGRAGVFIVRSDRFQSWRLVGFEPQRDDSGPLELPTDAAGILENARDTGSMQVDGSRAPEFAELPAGHPCAAVPLAVGGAVVAVLYVDSNSESALPTHSLEILARHAARALESLTAFKAARAVVAQSGMAPIHVDAAPDDAGGDEDASARRYARLLVSEIKLYHEPDVLAGRRERNLMSRLAGEITRARSLYEQRVPADVRERTDYFGDELLRTLANGDASLLQLT